MPSVRAVEKLAKALGCTVSELIEPASTGGSHPHRNNIVAEMVHAVATGEMSAQEALDALVAIGVISCVPRDPRVGGGVKTTV
jgi:hypothetical protein